MAASLTTLREVLLNADSLDWRYHLYLPGSEDWDEATPCAVIAPEDGDDSDDLSPFAKDRRLRYALGIAAVQDVVANARMQKPQAGISDLLGALRFYFQHDAFIILP